MDNLKLVIPEKKEPLKVTDLKLNLNGHKPKRNKNSYNRMLNKIRRFLR